MRPQTTPSIYLALVSLVVALLMGAQPVSGRPVAQQLSITDLGTLPGGTTSYAHDINNRGQVVGFGNTARGALQTFLWKDGEMTDLGALGGIHPEAWGYGINDRGQVVGSSTTATGEQHAFMWEDGKMTDLGTLPGGGYSEGSGINNRGQVVGGSTMARGRRHAFLWEDGEMTDLGALYGKGYSQAYAINGRGQIAGISTTPWEDGYRAILWSR